MNRPQRPANSDADFDAFQSPTRQPPWVMIAVWLGTVLLLTAAISMLIQHQQMVDKLVAKMDQLDQRKRDQNIEHLFWVISHKDEPIDDRTTAFKQLVKTGNDEWSSAYLTELKLNGIDLAKTEFEKAYFKACKLQNADLSEAKFFKCDFELSDMSKANLRLADFSESFFFKTVLTGANMQLTRMRKVDLQQAIIRDANLQFCELPESSLRMADFTGSDLLDADLTACDLTNAKFVRCNLKNVKLPFREEMFQGADFTDSNWWEAKHMPVKTIDNCKKKFAPSKKTSETMRVKYKLWLEKEGGGI